MEEEKKNERTEERRERRRRREMSEKGRKEKRKKKGSETNFFFTIQALKASLDKHFRYIRSINGDPTNGLPIHVVSFSDQNVKYLGFCYECNMCSQISF